MSSDVERPLATALDAALRALRHRDRSEGELRSRLIEQGFDSAECKEALATLVRIGLADDTRYAEARSRALAERGAGDIRIRHELAQAGVADEVVEHAIASLGSEAERARTIVARRGAGPRTARYLRGKGFSEDAVAGAGAHSGDDGLYD